MADPGVRIWIGVDGDLAASSSPTRTVEHSEPRLLAQIRAVRVQHLCPVRRQRRSDVADGTPAVVWRVDAWPIALVGGKLAQSKVVTRRVRGANTVPGQNDNLLSDQRVVRPAS